MTQLGPGSSCIAAVEVGRDLKSVVQNRTQELARKALVH
jgi:hypothetical protein